MRSYVEHLQAFLPPGDLWPRSNRARLTALLAGLASEFSRVDDRAADLRSESGVRDASELLPDFERVLGPDPCGRDLGALSLADRQRVAHQRWTARGGQSRAYFRAIAGRLGAATEILEYWPSDAGILQAGDNLVEDGEQFVWTMFLAFLDELTFDAGGGVAGDPLGRIILSDVECEVRRLAPAHTVPVFSYTLEPEPLPTTPATLLVNFRTDRLQARNPGRPFHSAKAVETVDSVRASPATRFDADRILRSAAAHELRLDHDPSTGRAKGLFSEAAGTNISRNPRAEGAVVGAIGSGGAHPTGWHTSHSGNGITVTVVGIGVEDGIPYEEVRFDGTATAHTAIVLGGGTGTGAAQGETWTSSFHASVVGGSLSGLTSVLHWLWEAPSSTNGSGPITLDGRPLREARHVLTRTLSAANTNAIFHQLRANVANGQAIDVTIRFALPQMERSPVATSIILPPAGTIAASSRALDNASLPIGEWYDPSQGTVVAEIDVPVRAGLGNRAVFSIDRDAGGANRIILFLNAAGNLETRLVGPSNRPASAIFVIPADVSSRMNVALSWSLSGSSIALNGDVRDHPLPIELPAAPTHLRLANGQGGTIPLTGHLGRLLYYPKQLAADELRRLTTIGA